MKNIRELPSIWDIVVDPTAPAADGLKAGYRLRRSDDPVDLADGSLPLSPEDKIKIKVLLRSWEDYKNALYDYRVVANEDQEFHKLRRTILNSIQELNYYLEN